MRQNGDDNHEDGQEDYGQAKGDRQRSAPGSRGQQLGTTIGRLQQA
jgi:hypothetical protein